MKKNSFRFYDEELDIYVYSESYFGINYFFEDYEDCHGEAVLEQAIGLEDKNGVELFEGDVVRVYLRDKTEICDIVYDYDKAMYVFQNRYNTYNMNELTTNQLDFIGNLHGTIN